jgi:hypothetical protein
MTSRFCNLSMWNQNQIHTGKTFVRSGRYVALSTSPPQLIDATQPEGLPCLCSMRSSLR